MQNEFESNKFESDH